MGQMMKVDNLDLKYGWLGAKRKFNILSSGSPLVEIQKSKWREKNKKGPF